MGPRRQALREATEGLHRDLDGHIGRLVDHEAYERYINVMTAFRSVVEPPFEAALAQAGTNFIVPLLIAGDLRRDCRDLGLEPQLPGLALLSFAGHGAWLGAAYVLEGSALGARILYGDAQLLGFRRDYGARHLAKQVHAAGRWPAFLKALEAAEPFDQKAATAAAQQTFAAAIAIAEGLRSAHAEDR